MDIVQLYMDYGVDFRTEGHKHCRPGWVNTPCPFCISEQGHEGYHLGYELSSDHYYCWRCGWHPALQTISKLINLSETETRGIIKGYGLIVSKPPISLTSKVNTKDYRMPSGIGPLEKNHITYLEKRGFNPSQLIRDWHIVGTGPMSTLDGLSYKFRIIVPVIWEARAVSFISRDITNKSSYRYIVCPKERELIHHKHIIYGKQEDWTDVGICVEGVTDVWRFGSVAFATFGIEYTPQQVRVIAKNFKRVFIIFDDEPQALNQANKLSGDLKFRGIESKVISIRGDPASLSQKEANYLLKQLLINRK